MRLHTGTNLDWIFPFVLMMISIILMTYYIIKSDKEIKKEHEEHLKIMREISKGK
jgi:preprotein translocase subunit YajC